MLRPLLGLALAGYGLLVLLRLVPHESAVAGALALAVGVAFLALGLPRVAAPRAPIVLAAGLALTAGVLAYNALRASSLSPPELAIAAYGAALAASSAWIARPRVATAVGWSFAVVLAPLALFALNGVLSASGAGAAGTAGAGGGGDAADPLVHALVVQPSAAVLRATGTEADVQGNALVVATPRGTLSLGVGLVCAGLYPMVLFGGVVALHAWRTRPPATRLAAWVGGGLAGLWALNLLRIVAVTRVGIAWGPGALQTFHAHIGWILFGGFMAAFWTLVLRRTADAPSPTGTSGDPAGVPAMPPPAEPTLPPAPAP